MGRSGGRSRRHPTGETARRRNTPRERQQIDPPLDQLELAPIYRLTTRGEKVKKWAEELLVLGLCAGVGGFGAVLVIYWFAF